MRETDQTTKEITLAPNEYAYMQDISKGAIEIYTGPATANQTAQKTPIVYQDGQFIRRKLINEAICKNPIAVEGFYMVLMNPVTPKAKEEDQEGESEKYGAQPSQGLEGRGTPGLNVGNKINIPGPCTFPLWPGQQAEVRRGHQLKYNEYLLVKVYNEKEARENWPKAIVETVGDSSSILSTAPKDLAVGRHFVIKGIDVSFYIPPTGVSVVKEKNGDFVRQALTLEALEYCILLDENGSKRYEKGPNVVFPKPTETFIEREGRKKFRALELNPIQGIHIKVIKDYEEEEVKHKEGDELFIKGDETAIYFPREEHSLIKYDGKPKHFAIAVPPGEGRYVLNRMTGEIKTHEGYDMLLPDPRGFVIVRRALTDKQVILWYPGNEEALAYNRGLRSIAAEAPTTRSGAVSDGDYIRGTKKRKGGRAKGESGEKALFSHVGTGLVVPDSATFTSTHSAGPAIMESSAINASMDLAMAEEFSRASTYTQPRTVTLDTKYQGVPRIDLWTGYAVMVVSPSGKREVKIGPQTILLNYDETLETLALSTGKPKTTDSLLETVYLQVENNFVTDIVKVKTADHVEIDVKLIYKNIDFDKDEKEKWFSIKNYVKHLTDRCRSILKSAVKKLSVKQFHDNPIDQVRDIILGEKEGEANRRGLAFPENGMKINDVDVVYVNIVDQEIKKLLDGAQRSAVHTNIVLENDQRNLDYTRKHAVIKQEQAKVSSQTVLAEFEIKRQELEAKHVNKMAELENQKVEETKQIERQLNNLTAKVGLVEKEVESSSKTHDERMRQDREKLTIEMDRMIAQTESYIKKAQAVSPELALSIKQLSDVAHFKALVKEFGDQAIINGKGILETMKQVFDFLPENMQILKQIGNGSKSVKS